jgi:hypothetical protein
MSADDVSLHSGVVMPEPFASHSFVEPPLAALKRLQGAVAFPQPFGTATQRSSHGVRRRQGDGCSLIVTGVSSACPQLSVW